MEGLQNQCWYLNQVYMFKFLDSEYVAFNGSHDSNKTQNKFKLPPSEVLWRGVGERVPEWNVVLLHGITNSCKAKGNWKC